jgi:uncharacterized protein YecE (DUF72 family)
MRPVGNAITFAGAVNRSTCMVDIVTAGTRMHGRIDIGTAGWSIPRVYADRFPPEGSHLDRYAHRLHAVEINSSFYRPHRPSTYARWTETVPEEFRFAVKVPREITHQRRLVEARDALERFLAEVSALGHKLGPLLIQLPPSLPFRAEVVRSFLADLRDRFAGVVVCEPRHDSWFAEDAEDVLTRFQIARVAADPARVPRAADPGGWTGLAYYRLHGSPRVYYSPYPPEYLDGLARQLASCAASGMPTWCVFDNTALGAATADALTGHVRQGGGVFGFS